MANGTGHKWHTMETDEVLMALKTSRTGLGEGEAERRLREFGPNLLEERKKTSALDILFSQFREFFVFILLVGIIISIITAFLKYEAPVLEDYVEAITIGAIVVLNVGVGFVQEYRSERAMEALRQFTVPRSIDRSPHRTTEEEQEKTQDDEGAPRQPATRRRWETSVTTTYVSTSQIPLREPHNSCLFYLLLPPCVVGALPPAVRGALEGADPTLSALEWATSPAPSGSLSHPIHL